MRLALRRLLLMRTRDEQPIAQPQSAALREDSDNELQEDGDPSLRED